MRILAGEATPSVATAKEKAERSNGKEESRAQQRPKKS